MTTPQGKAISVSIASTPETAYSYASEDMAMVMEDGTVWKRTKSADSSWKWSEWSLEYSPLKTQETA